MITREYILTSIKELKGSPNQLDYLTKIFNDKEESGFLWSKFYLLLSRVAFRHDIVESEYILASKLQLFMMATDLIDDVMDGDNVNLYRIDEPLHFGLSMVFETLYSLLGKINPEDVKKAFVHNIKESFYFQCRDMTNEIQVNQIKNLNFSLSVKKSIYLVNAIEQLSFKEGENRVKMFSKYFAIASQISNDVKDIHKLNSYDLIHRKATFPILHSYYLYKKNNKKEILNKFNMYFFEKEDNLFEEIRQLILLSGGLEYSNIIVKRYYRKAYDSLHKTFPCSNEEINLLFEYLGCLEY